MPGSNTPWLHRYDRIVDALQTKFVPLFLLICRLSVAYVFFRSGLIKLNSWDNTLFLFEYEYQVPLLPYEVAAFLGTVTEIIVPIFIALGLLTRPMAFVLFLFNIIAVISYPLLWQGGFYDHQLWGLMLLINIVWGPGRFSIDHWLRPRQASSEASP